MYLLEASESSAGPADPEEAMHEPPEIAMAGWLQTLRFSQRQIEFVFGARSQHGDVFRIRAGIRGGAIVTCDPDHVRSLFTAEPEQVPTLTAESALRPVVGPASVLTTNGPAHLRQRKLLLPAFHGEAIERYTAMIERATEAEIDRWPIGRVFALAPRMQAITLRVIMAGVFGIEGPMPASSAEGTLVVAIKRLTAASTSPVAKIAELANHGRLEPVGLMRRGVAILDRAVYRAINARRQDPDLAERTDILSLLLQSSTESGDELSDQELRDELLTLLLAGFETTANSLAWTWERLLRTPHAHERLCHAVRMGEEPAVYLEACIQEGMRSRPVIPIVGRRVWLPWRLGEYVVPAGSAISASILLVHHREDLYPDAFAFRPERWLGRKPGSYEWIPFGGGTRRCLGATLAMAEQRIVLTAMARRLEMSADRPEPERAQNRNVTMIPARGARAIVHERRLAANDPLWALAPR